MRRGWTPYGTWDSSGSRGRRSGASPISAAPSSTSAATPSRRSRCPTPRCQALMPASTRPPASLPRPRPPSRPASAAGERVRSGASSRQADRPGPSPGPERPPLGVRLDPGDVPPAEIGRVEQRPVEGDVGRVAERVRGRVLDVDLDPTGAVEAQDARGLITGDEQVAGIVEGEPVGQARQVGGGVAALAGLAVRADRDARDAPGEGLGDQERAAPGLERHAVGEGHRSVVPEPALAAPEVVAPDTRARIGEVVAVRDVEAAPRPIDHGVVRDHDPGRGEALEPPAREVEAEDAGVLEVAREEGRLAVERQAEREPARAGDLLYPRAVAGDLEDLAVLAPAPDLAPGTDRDTFRMLQPRCGEDALEEDRGALGREHGRLGGGEAHGVPPSLSAARAGRVASRPRARTGGAGCGPAPRRPGRPSGPGRSCRP